MIRLMEPIYSEYFLMAYRIWNSKKIPSMLYIPKQIISVEIAKIIS